MLDNPAPASDADGAADGQGDGAQVLGLAAVWGLKLPGLETQDLWPGDWKELLAAAAGRNSSRGASPGPRQPLVGTMGASRPVDQVRASAIIV